VVSVLLSFSCNLLYISCISCSSCVSYESGRLLLHRCSFRSRRSLVERSSVLLPLGRSRLRHHLCPLSGVRSSGVRSAPVSSVAAFARLAFGPFLCPRSGVRPFNVRPSPPPAFAGSAFGPFPCFPSRRSLIQRSAVRSVFGVGSFSVRPSPSSPASACLSARPFLAPSVSACRSARPSFGVRLSTYTPLLRPTRSLVPRPIPCCAFAALLLGVPPVRRAVTGAGNIFLCRTIQLGNSSLPDLIGWGGKGLPMFSI